MSENDFYLLKGNSYRGSRYGNFFGGGIDSQGNVSSAATENASNQVGTSGETNNDLNAGQGQEQGVSQGLAELPQSPKATDVVIGSALPYAGVKIGQAAGSAIGSGATAGQGLSYGASTLANKVSGGLIGTPASATNAALSGMSGAGPATQSAVNAASKASNVKSIGSGASLGAAAGAGIASAAVTLLATGNVKEAAKSGVGTAVGTAIGNAIVPGIGGFVGGFIGGLFCFVGGTPIFMANGSMKNVEDLVLGDMLLEGGMVVGAGQAFCDDLYTYKNTVLNGRHAVFEDGKWIRAQDSELSEEYIGDDFVVYPIVCQNHILVTPWFISADMLEIDEAAAGGVTDDEIISCLNDNLKRNAMLLEVEKGNCAL